MTKIRNTKKGMAKKTLSISLAVAMLATSNVPVWAAEDLFSDGAAAVEAVEAPVEDVFTDAEAADVVEEAPVVEEVVETPEARENLDSSDEVNVNNYTVKDLKITVGEWGQKATVSGTIKDGKYDVTGLKYVWLADGVQAAGQGAVGTLTDTQVIANCTYTPVIEDFGKTLSLMIYEEGATWGSQELTTIFRKTVTGDVVQAKDITSNFNATLRFDANVVNRGKVTYNGTQQKPAPTNTYKVDVTGRNSEKVTITEKQIDWHYEVSGNDFTNVTEKDILVYGTLEGTYDKDSTAYGYTIKKTAEAKYQIAPLGITTSNLKPSMVTESVEYTAGIHTFGKKDVKIEVKVSDSMNVDITDALKADAKFQGSHKAVGTNYKISSSNWLSQFADTDEAKAILKNFEIPTTPLGTVATTDGYAITKRNLGDCTGTVIKEFMLSSFVGLDTSEEIVKKMGAGNIVLTGKDGETFNLSQMYTNKDVVIQINEPFFEALKTNTTGTIEDALTVRYSADKNNVEGHIDLPVTLVKRVFGTVSVMYNNTKTPIPTTAANAGNMSVPYIGKAYDLQASTGALHGLYVSGAESSEYTVSYNDNVNAGVVEVTITGTDSFEGTTKKVYFKIAQDAVSSTEFKVKESVTVNPENNHDASLYKEALAAKIETTLADRTKAVLEDGKDYTVKYYYTKNVGHKTEAAIKADAGTNVPGNYVYAVATLVKDGNYTTKYLLSDYARISEKSISNVTVTVEKPSYTFTGKEIVADVTVKDGSVVLEKGVDYTLKFKDNIEVGTATVEVIPTPNSDYDPSTSASATFEITPAKAEDVKVTLGGTTSAIPVAGKTNTFNYTGRQVKPAVTEVKLNGVDVTKYFDITYPVYGENVNAGKEMGSITITPKVNDKNFTGSKIQLFDIKGKELKGDLKLYYGNKTEVEVDGDRFALNKDGHRYSFYYDGEAQTFATEKFTADSKYDVTEGSDYEIKYINNKDAGTAFVAVVAKGNYEGALNTNFGGDAYPYEVKDGQLFYGSTLIESNIVDIIAFNIEAAVFTARNVTVKHGSYAAGKPVKPEVSVVVNGRTLVEGEDYRLVLTAIDGISTPDKFVNVTKDEPYYVAVVAMGGYRFDTVNGSNTWTWGIDKKDLADCSVTVTKNGEDFDLKVMNDNVVELKEAFEVTDNGDGTATVSVVDGGKSYTGSATVTIIDPEDKGAVGMVEVADVKVDGNKATVILNGEAENAEGYDYVISTENDWTNGRVDISKNQLRTTTNFFYLPKGTYYAYAHAYRRDENGKKIFSPEFSNRFKFTVTAVTPEKPVITKVTRNGNDVTVTYTESANASGYDVVLGTEYAKINGEKRPVKYGTLVKKNLKEGTTSVTFKDVPEGTYYAGLHAFNRSRQDNNDKVFSPWSNIRTVVVK